MRILITGAAGFIGSHLAERLAVQGHEVTGLDCLRDFYSIDLKLQNCRELEQRGVKMITPDLSTDDLTDAVARADVIYHLAAQPGLAPGLPTNTYVRDNVQATARLVDAAVKYGRLAAFINVSTSSVYGLLATGNEEIGRASCRERVY
jgi:UDP-glucuronate 4-epimerase